MNRPVRINTNLIEVRDAFNFNIRKKLGVKKFPKTESDNLLARSIKEAGLLDVEVNIKKKNKRGMLFDVKL